MTMTVTELAEEVRESNRRTAEANEAPWPTRFTS